MIPRMEVLALSLLMERELRANDAARGGDSWKAALPPVLAAELVEQARKLNSLVEAWSIGPRGRYHANVGVAAIASKAADIANYAMMVADVCGALAMTVERPGGDA